MISSVICRSTRGSSARSWKRSKVSGGEIRIVIGMNSRGMACPMGWASRVPIMATARTGRPALQGESGHAGVALVQPAVR